MENVKTAALRKRKAAVKTRLMSAIAMLLVATLMLSTSTYAWFVLSTAPEVKGMSTTVGANGSLEIALRDWDEEADAEVNHDTYVGASYSVTNNWKETNNSWGNVIDLGHQDYGLNGAADAITLYPARLNLTASGTVDLTSPLKTAQYGTDGRVANVDKTLGTGRYTADGYQEGQTGVRGIGDYSAGTGTQQTITKADLAARAKTRMDDTKNRVTTGIGTAVNTVLPYVATLQASDDDYIASGTGDRIVAFLQSFQAQVTNLQAAVGYAYLIEQLGSGDWTDPAQTPGTILNEYGAMTASDIAAAAAAGSNAANAASALATIVTNATTAATNAAGALITNESDPNYGKYSVDALKSAVASVLAYNNLYTEDGSGVVTKLSSLSGASDKMAALTNATAVYFYGDSGSFAQVAAITGKYSFYLTLASATAYVSSATYTEGVAFADVDNAGYLAAVTLTDSTDVASTYTSNAAKGATYGFALDLAFRTNSATGLVLSAAQERVSGDGDQSEELMGGGSKITAEDAALLQAVYVAFIDPADGTLYGVAKADASGNLLLCEYTVNADSGVLSLTAPATANVANQTIVDSLTQNVQNNVTAIVWLDGDAYTSNGGDGATVGVNLQFASTVALTPMDYTGYLTTGGETTGGGNSTSLQVGGTRQLTASEAPTGAALTWASSDTDVATVDNTGLVTAVGAGTANITASWEAGGEGEDAYEAGSQTFPITVAAAGTTPAATLTIEGEGTAIAGVPYNATASLSSAAEGTYAWTCSGATGSYSFTISNAATCDVTFNAAGTYTLTCTFTPTSGTAVSNTITVTVG